MAALPAANGQVTLSAFVTVLATADSRAETEVAAALASHLRELLPAPLLPSSITKLETLPLTANGKVDRSALAKLRSPADCTVALGGGAVVPPATPNERRVLQVWSTVLGVAPEQLSVEANFFHLGGDSLNALRLVTEGHRHGLPLTVRQIFEQPTVRALAALLPDAVALQAGMKPGAALHGAETLFKVRRSGEAGVGTPFPLIGITRAYYVGLYLSPFSEGLNPQIYFEWEWKERCDVPRLQAALNAMVARHPVWRAVVTDDGMMRVLRDVPRYTIDVEVQPEAATEEYLLATRAQMMDHGPRPEAWPLFECRVSHLGGAKSRVHFCINLFIMDGVSDLTMRREISALYKDLRTPLPTPRLTYQDYCVSLCGADGKPGLAASAEYQKAKAYWIERIPRLPPPPELPVLPAEGDAAPTGQFDHIGAVLSVETLRAFKARCAAHAVTPTSVLLCVYALTLARHAASRHLLLNILHCLRHPVDDEVTQVIGNHSSSFLLDADMRPRLAVVEHVRRITSELTADLEHAAISGVEVMEEVNKARRTSGGAVAPFVFVSAMGLEHAVKEWRDLAFTETYVHEATPGTWMVNAVKEYPDGRLMWGMDVMRGVFPPGVVDSILKMYGDLLHALCTDDAAWDKRPDELLPAAPAAEPVAPPCPLERRLMHEPFLERFVEAPDAPAVVWGWGGGDQGASQQLSYAGLEAASRAVWGRLAGAVGVARGDGGGGKERGSGPPVVAVVAEKSWEQLAGVLGALRAGGAYLPINAKQLPRQRIQQLLGLSDACAVVADASTLASCGWLRDWGLPVVDVGACVAASGGGGGGVGGEGASSSPPVSPRDLAYLIYTSGSTGVPKGVCCHHEGAMNTIAYLNERYGVGRGDRVLGLSSLSFDLSVYDVFGLLASGGAVVVPPAEALSPPDPAAWLRLVVAHDVTVWNTVPAFMELLVAHAEHARERLPSSLRLVWLSGDWIPLSLPGRIRALSDCAGIQIVSMGGATEAAIWSNIYEVGEALPSGWKSIPYGRPLRNQTMYVLDEQFEHCEAWVTGSIHIGGAGVAHGYYKDAARSSAQFVSHPRTGEALFRTGDLGRLRPDGELEILGREDSQVKVNGFRVELGELEEVLTASPQVAAAAARLYQGQLAAYVVLAPEAAGNEDVGELQRMCAASLPSYMVPRYLSVVGALPLNGNGKVDRRALPAPVQAEAARSAGSGAGAVPPSTPQEEAVRDAMARVLKLPTSSVCCASSDFFALGGDSLSALRLLMQLRAVSPHLGVQQLFAAPTVRGICEAAAAADATAAAKASSAEAARPRTSTQLRLVCLQKGAPSSSPPTALVLVHAAGASALSYMPLVRRLPAEQPVYAVDDEALTGGAPFTLPSIEEAAAQSAALLRASLGGGEGAPRRVVLAGWSYGGVVALQLAAALAEEGGGLEASGVLMYDAPLGQSEGKGFHRQAAAESEGGAGEMADKLRQLLSPSKQGAAATASEEEDDKALAQLAARHFAACNALLDAHVPGARGGPLRCPVVDVRPRVSECKFLASLDHLSEAAVTERVMAGDHWTMLFGDNAPEAAGLLAELLD